MNSDLIVDTIGKNGFKKDTENLTAAQSEIISRIGSAYIHLENVIRYDAAKLSDSGKANLRRAQGELQKLRLKLSDLLIH